MDCILLVEDNKETQELVKAALGSEFELHIAGDLKTADQMVANVALDLVLLDIELPDGDGFHYCAKLMADDATASLPVIFLTGKNEVTDKVVAFQLGADDYIDKPFNPLELKARVGGRLNKLKRSKRREEVLRCGNLRLNLSQQRAMVEIEEGKPEPVDLTPLEFKILVYFAKHDEHVLSRDQIIDNVWGPGINILDRTIDTHVSNIRKKIFGSVFTLKAIHGAGYSFSKVTAKKRVA